MSGGKVKPASKYKKRQSDDFKAWHEVSCPRLKEDGGLCDGHSARWMEAGEFVALYQTCKEAFDELLLLQQADGEA